MSVAIPSTEGLLSALQLTLNMGNIETFHYAFVVTCKNYEPTAAAAAGAGDGRCVVRRSTALLSLLKFCAWLDNASLFSGMLAAWSNRVRHHASLQNLDSTNVDNK